jgi:hypothetical protein
MDTMIYVVMVKDRLVDTEVYLFATAEKALDYARQVADDYGCPEKDEENNEDVMDCAALKANGRHYRAISPYGDCLWIMRKSVNLLHYENPLTPCCFGVKSRQDGPVHSTYDYESDALRRAQLYGGIVLPLYAIPVALSGDIVVPLYAALKPVKDEK